ncbi:hypothetical protein LTR37_014591 [Vermiconidia calcicola]|uniref:Uncharacterized protein n=1 Tax=Vermiconidia calcicola TaxID=1690605 RepID=A0ACC3MUR5_9PEZI|nr:hypothetical protein LTR37_014591 [Vermiconidia calcicola]
MRMQAMLNLQRSFDASENQTLVSKTPSDDLSMDLVGITLELDQDGGPDWVKEWPCTLEPDIGCVRRTFHAALKRVIGLATRDASNFSYASHRVAFPPRTGAYRPFGSTVVIITVS